MTATEPGAPNDAWPPAPGGTPDRSDPLPADVRRAAVPVPRASAPDVGAHPDAVHGLAWLVRSVTHVPGILQLVDGRLRFVSTRGVVVDGIPASLAIAPARTGRGGFRLTVGDERLRLHVVRFAGAVDVPADLRRREATGALLTAGEPTAGAVWRDLIAASRPVRQGAGPAGAETPEPPTPSARSVGALGWRPARGRRACATPARWC